MNNRNDIVFRERIARDNKIVDKFNSYPILICGIGALGSNLVLELTRQGFNNLSVIDFDRVEKHNIGTTCYTLNDIGKFKIESLEMIIYHINNQGLNNASKLKLSDKNIKKILKKFTKYLIIDCFDNTVDENNMSSRKILYNYCDKHKLNCIHCGMSDDGYSEVTWNEKYKIYNNNPDEVDEDGNPCENGMMRNLVMITVIRCCESIIQFITDNNKDSYRITIKDFTVNKI